VHDERDDGKDDEQVNEETAYMQDEESAKPKNDEHHSQNEKH
jgi:hypothetical protein